MSEEFLPHIFEPFSQESTGTTALYGGTGLGLAISKNIVDMMDGRITVRSIKEIGTEFMVDVKLGISEEEKQRHNQRKQDYNFSHLKTLVVDDDVAVCEGAVATLKEIGIKAEWVDSGRKAVDRVEILWAEGRYYDMILIDWKMPGMDGIETARRIRRIVGPEVTIIIMTAYDWIAIEHEAKLAGVNLLMSKPMFKSSLVSAFTKALGKKEEEARELEILVHTSDSNLFGAIGHVDICYQGKVISYGSYDPFSERLFGTIGDGVLFKVDKEPYIELCKKESQKTLFGYSLSLTEEENQAVEKRLAEIDQLLEPWDPPRRLLEDGQPTYAYKLKYDLGAELYKFTSSRFKSYFVLSTNCCLLADSIVGQAGTAVLDVRGVIAPGTYQDYLEYEFEAPNGRVHTRTVY